MNTACSPRNTFTLYREEDETGISGTGTVAEGVQWSDGTADVHWFGAYQSFVHWPRGLEAVEYVNGHKGLTRVVWDK